MADTSESTPSEHAAASGVLPLEDMEQDLNTADKALAALDAGDLDEAEALVAQLDSLSSAEPSGGDGRSGGSAS